MKAGLETHEAASALEALGNETRLLIFRLLVRAGEEGLPVREIQRALGVPASTLSHHIARLVWIGLLRQERRGREQICTANFALMDRVVTFLTHECCVLAEPPARGRPAREPGAPR